MLTRKKSSFAPPVFLDKPEDTYLAQIIQGALLLSAGFLAFAMLLVVYVGLVRRTVPQAAALQALAIIGVGFVPLIFAAYLVRRGRLSIAGALVAWTVGIVVVLVVFRGGDITRPVLFTNAVALVLAGLMVRRRGAIFVATGIFAAATVALLAISTRVPPAALAPAPPLSYALVDIFILFSMAALLEFSNRNLHEVLRRADASERDLAEKNTRLFTLTQELEVRADERTAELRIASAQIEHRASQFAAIVDIARSISIVQDIDLLLPQVAEVVSRRFGFYHAGIFLIDDRREFAVLRAASSEGGARMLDRNHRLKVGAQGIVGYVAQSGGPRIAADVGADAVFFNNPDLPETHSELALPLIAAGQVIGVLDVQSDQRAAFTAEDVEVLSALASQVSIAIENARLFSQTRQALAEVERATRLSTRTAWQQYAEEEGIIGYRYSGRTPVILGAPERTPELERAASSGESATSARALAVPIKLRGQTIGVLGLSARGEDRVWEENDLAVAQAAAERVALALENARLVSTAQRRAAKERLIGEISAKITATSDLESVIQTAVEELGRSLPGAEVAIQFRSDAD